MVHLPEWKQRREAYWWSKYVARYPDLASIDGRPAGFDARTFDVDGFVAGEEWRFASTMADSPHEYVMLHKANDRQGWVSMFYLILDEGYDRPWHRVEFRTLIVGDHGYFIRAEGVPPGGIINRATLDELVLPAPGAQGYWPR